MELLDNITELSHEFGTTDYVLGGGGNTSVKNETTVWVKPSGTSLAAIKPESFVAIDRRKLSQLYKIQPPQAPSERERIVRELMADAVLPQTPGRASVEAPLHDSISYRYVVHTHPAVVNGLTCSKNGKAVCAKLFPQALWLDYIDPGYTLCMEVRREIQAYKASNGHEPYVIFLKNHGVFVAADTPKQIRSLYEKMIAGLKELYQRLHISTELEVASLSDSEWIAAERAKIIDVMQPANVSIVESGLFDYAVGPISPDHIVYAKSYPFVGESSVEAFAEFEKRHGYLPQVVVCQKAIFGIALSPKLAELTLAIAKDAALIKKLAHAFGGIDYMTDRARQFIENWEVESYRSKQV